VLGSSAAYNRHERQWQDVAGPGRIVAVSGGSARRGHCTLVHAQRTPVGCDNSAPDSGVLGCLATRILAALPAAARFGLAAPHLAEQLRAEPAAAAARIETYLAADATGRDIPAEQVRLLIYLDQLEEIFTLTSLAGQSAALLDAVAALSVLPTVWVVATLRSDFMHRLESYPAIMELLRRRPPYTLLSPAAMNSRT